MIEAKIHSIRMSLVTQHRVVILKEINAERYLPIWIGAYEADAIAVELQEFSVHYDSMGASAYIGANYQKGDVVIHTNKLSYLPFIYLKTPGRQFVTPEEPGNPHDDLLSETRRVLGLKYTPVEEVVGGLNSGSRVWLILTPPQPGQTDYQERTVKSYLDRQFQAQASREFYGETLYLFLKRGSI